MAATGRSGPGEPADVDDPLAFARGVYSAPRGRSPEVRFADAVYGRETSSPFHSPEQVRRHWFAEWRRRTGYGDSGDRDNVILITARQGKGEGKSALGFDIAAGIGRPITPADLPNHVAYRARRFLEILPTLSRGELGMYDEAGEGLLNTEFWSEESRVLTKAITISRDVHATLVLCVPAVSMFNATFLRALVDYWIQVRARGTALVHPKPGERYTKARGIGWYPDREWNPLVWAKPDRAFWRAYSGYRRESRQSELDRFASELDGAQRIKRAPPDTTCHVCGLGFSRIESLRRHEKESCPGSRRRAG